jgi:hypothetical protein
MAHFVEPIDREVTCRSNDNNSTANHVWNDMDDEQSLTKKQKAPNRRN